MKSIPVIIDEIQEDTETKRGTLSSPSRTLSKKQPKVRLMDVGKLRQSLSDLSEGISEICSDIKKVGDFKLKQVEVLVEVTAEGGLALVGLAKVGTKGAINLTFTDE
ncbi:hypothetical protein MHK_003870 [Candidatus Magnetomorum sp. HK-1]|nr:hypothetical protein MHK_003870 [Candidatus Magnetomorum sp. HK-1]